MKYLFYILIFFTTVARAQTSTDQYSLRLNSLGTTWYVGSDFSNPIFGTGSTNGYWNFFKPMRLYNLNTTQQNALTGAVAGQLIFNTDSLTVSMYTGSEWLPLSTKAYSRSVGGAGGGVGSGDFSSNTSSSVDNEIVLFSSTGGKTGKRATQTGVLIGTSGVLSGATTSSGISAALSDETGTGVLVFGTSPTFTTNITSPIVHGSSSASGSLQLSSTSNGTKGTVTIGNFSYNEATNVATFAGNILNNSASAYDIGATGSRYRYAFVQGLNINSSAAGAASTVNVIPGFTITNGTSLNATGNQDVMTLSSAGWAGTANRVNFLNIPTFTINPTSGAGEVNILRIANTVNITGTSTAIPRAILVDWTLTSAPGARAIETMAGQIRFNGLADVGTADSLLTYEDGYVEKVATSVVAHGPTSNTYTPTTASPTNIDAVTPLGVKWFRVGKMVHVYGAVDIDATTTGTVTAFTMTLPTGVFGGTFVNNYDASGIANVTYSTANESGVVFAIAASALVELRFYAASTASNRWRFSFSYISD